METIIEKLMKLAALAERGEYGEAENAKRLLEAQLAKHGLTMEDLVAENRKPRRFHYKTKSEETLLFYVLENYLGSKSEAFRTGKINKTAKYCELQITDLEYADLADRVDFYIKLFRLERKRVFENLVYSFCIKQELFDPDHNDDEYKPLTKEEIERQRQLLKLASAFDNTKFVPRSNRLEKQQLRLPTD